MKIGKIAAAIFLLANTDAFAQKFIGGAAIIPIPGQQTSSAFNLKTDAASIYLEKAVLRKENGWFTNDKEVIISAKMIISSRKKDGASTDLPLTRVYKFDVSSYDDGRIEIPLKSLVLLDQFNLSSENYLITSITLDLSLSKKKEKSEFSKTLLTIIESSKKVPIPVNPYSEYVNTFGTIFGDVVNDALSDGAETIPFMSFGLRFLQGEKAIQFTEKTGLHAVIIGGEKKGDGYVSLDGISSGSLAYSAEQGLIYSGRPIKNNYLLIRVVASTDPWKAMMQPAETIARLRAEAPDAIKIATRSNIAIQNIIGVSKAKSDTTIDSKTIENAINEINTVRRLEKTRFK